MMKMLWWLLVLGALGGGGYWWWLRSVAAASTGPEFRVAEVARGEIVQTVTASGKLSAVETVEIGSQVSGNLQEIHVDFNDIVKEGQLVAKIDPATYEARVVQAEGELLNAQAAFELAQIKARRAKELRAKELIAQSELDEADAELKQKEATVKIKQATLMNAKVDVERTNIISPIDGIVISKAVEVGQTVQASFSAPKLFEIARDLRDMEISADVSEADIGQVAEGQEATFTVDAYPELQFKGKVQQVRNNPTTVQNVVTFATIIGVKNDGLKLKPGMTANVTITTARRDGVVRVPNAALRYRPPEGASVIGAPAESAAAATNAPPASAPSRPGSGKGDLSSMPEEVRQRMLQRYDKNGDGQLDDAERAAMREAFRGRGGGGGPGGGGPPGGGSRGNGDAAPGATKTVYVIDAASVAEGRGSGELRAVSVTTGITDGAYTEIASGIEEGANVVIGTVMVETEPQQQTTNPFSPMRPRRGPR